MCLWSPIWPLICRGPVASLPAPNLWTPPHHNLLSVLGPDDADCSTGFCESLSSQFSYSLAASYRQSFCISPVALALLLFPLLGSYGQDPSVKGTPWPRCSDPAIISRLLERDLAPGSSLIPRHSSLWSGI